MLLLCGTVAICLGFILFAFIITSVVVTGPLWELYVPPISKRAKSSDFNGKILIIGAGTAGLFAGYTFKHLGVDFEILEANEDFGGRVQEMTDFADVPLDLGAEWIHVEPRVLKDLLLYENDREAVDQTIEIIEYQPQTYGSYYPKRSKRKHPNWLRFFYKEYKFRNTTWYSYLQNYVYPYVAEELQFNTVVKTIDYSNSTGNNSSIVVTTTDGREFIGDRVIVATPVSIIQEEDITFIPRLSNKRRRAFDSVWMAEGLKAWIEFDEQFYPDVQIPGRTLDFAREDKLYINGVFRKPTTRHVMTLFQVGDSEAIDRVKMDDKALFADIMADLDTIFDGKASKHYIQHHIQNWSAEPYIKGAYSYNDYDMEQVGMSLDQRVYFAGEYLSQEDQGTVHGAGLHGRNVAQRVLVDYANENM